MTETQIQQVVSRELPQFRNKEVKATLLHRGTNTVYKVEALGAEPVIYRHFGSTPVINRQVEQMTFLRVARAGLGPACLVYTPEYRIEEFLDGHQVRREEVEELVEPIAKRLAEVHALESGSAQPTSYSFFTQWKPLFERNFQEYEASLAPDRRTKLAELNEALLTEQPRALALVPHADGLVFSHNDVSYGNLLRHEKGIHLIDYEYAGLNFPAFDLAMLSNEVTYEYFYLQSSSFRALETGLSKERLNTLVETYCEAAKCEESEIWRQFYSCKAIAHYGCFLWALCHYQPGSEVWFDLLGFSESRLDNYRRALDLAP